MSAPIYPQLVTLARPGPNGGTPVGDAATPLVTSPAGSSAVSTDSGMSKFRILTAGPLTNVAQAVKAAAGNLYGLKVVNPNTVPIFIKFFNLAAASVVVGTTVPVCVFQVPANDGTNNGQLIITPGEIPLHYFSAAISVLATSVLADTGTQTAPGTTLLLVDVDYK